MKPWLVCAAALGLARSGWCRRTSRAGHNLCRDTPDRGITDTVEPAVEQIGDLTLEILSRNGVHAAPRAFEAAVPRRKRLTIAKRSPNATGTGMAQPFLPADCGLGNQASRAPVASATGVGNPRCTNGLEMHPAGDATAEPMAIPQALVAEGLHLDQNRRAACHYSANAGKAMVGVLDDMSECDCFRRELVARLAGWLEHHHGASRRCLGGQGEGGARQSIDEEHRCDDERRTNPDGADSSSLEPST